MLKFGRKSNMEDELENFVYKPCKKCASTDYKNTTGEEFKELPDGRMSVQPEACDKCTFDLMMQEHLLQ